MLRPDCQQALERIIPKREEAMLSSLSTNRSALKSMHDQGALRKNRQNTRFFFWITDSLFAPARGLGIMLPRPFSNGHPQTTHSQIQAVAGKENLLSSLSTDPSALKSMSSQLSPGKRQKSNTARRDSLLPNMQAEDLTPWQGYVATLSLDNVETTIAHIFRIDPDDNTLIVDVLVSNRPYPGSDQRAFAIPLARVLSVGPAPAGFAPRRPVPPLDPCRLPVTDLPRRIAFMLLFFVILGPGGAFLFFWLANKPFGIQWASMILYAAGIPFLTFTRTRGLKRHYLFRCPFVRPQLPQLALRHAGFLAALFILQTAVLQYQSRLPESWRNGSVGSMPTIDFILLIVTIGLGYVQVLTNRKLLDRAHLEYFSA
jgi:hypothetical protein